MGMTIDEAISWLVSITEHEGEDIPIYDDDVKAINIAIDTMRKYQQIRQIAFPLQFCSTDKLEHEAIMKICEEVEDGNGD